MANVLSGQKWSRLVIPAGLALVVAVAVVAFGSLRSSAPSALANSTPGSPHMYLDATSSNGLCVAPDTHPSGTAVLVGSSFQVGICIENQAAAPGAFEATILFDGTKIGGTEVADAGAALSDNPDANDGSGASFIGTSWDCTALGFAFPHINIPAGNTHIVCNDTTFGAGSTLTASPGKLATATYSAIGTSAGTPLALTTDGTSGTDAAGGVDCSAPGTVCDGAIIVILPSADIQVTKTAPAVAVAGSTIHYIITVTNAGPSTATNVNVFDDLVDTWTVGTVLVDGFAAGCAVINPPPYINVVNCALGNMTNGQVHVIDVAADTTLAVAGKVIVNAAAAGSGTLPGSIDEVPDPDFLPIEYAACLGDPTPPISVGLANPCPNNPTAIPDANLLDNLSPTALCASDRYNGTAFDNPPGTFVDINPTDECDNVALAATKFAPANVTISKSAQSSATVGDTVAWTLNVTNQAVGGFGPSSPASTVSVTDTVDANQSIVSASGVGYVCVVSGTPGVTPANTVTCTLTGSIAAGASANVTVNVKILASPSNVTCTDSAGVTFADPITRTATGTITCLPPNVAMYKDKHPETPTRQNVVNLWLCTPAYAGNFPAPVGPGNYLPAPPLFTQVGGLPLCNENGEGRLIIGEVLVNVNDPQGLGAFEFQLKFDHKIFDITITGSGWLYTTGRVPDLGSGVGGCTPTIINENYILFGCVSKNPQVGGVPVITNGPTGSGMVAQITILPESDLVDRLSPGQENGIARKILDENCEAADIYGDPLANSLGQPLPGIVTGGLIEDCGDLSVTVRRLEGDLNTDCKVDIADDQAIAFRYGSFTGMLRYDPFYDLEPALKDFDIDIKDLQKVFGRNGSVCSQSGLPADGTIPAQPPVQAISVGPL